MSDSKQFGWGGLLGLAAASLLGGFLLGHAFAPQAVLLSAAPGQPELKLGLGGQVHNANEIFADGINVNNDVQFVDGNGNATTSGLYVGGRALGNVGRMVRGSMSSSATTTAVSLYNSDSNARIVTLAGCRDTGSASSLGSVTWQAATSTATAGLGTTNVKLLNTAITRAASDVITTTSSAPTTFYFWPAGTYLNFVSGTTTNSGACYVNYE